MVIQKISNYASALRHPFFSYVKIVTKGYLTPYTYSTIYKYSLNSPEGHAVDIGPAQGGTTISIAKAFMNKKNELIYKVYSIEKGHSSNALADRTHVDDNKSVLEKNLKHFCVDKMVDIIMKYSDEAFTNGTAPSPISVLSIDADGGLDRDFAIFYNNLVPNGSVILDDYENKINNRASKLLRGTNSDIEKHKTDHRADKLADGTPLGKELLTYQFVNYLKKQGLLKEGQITGGNTWFGHKPENAPEFADVHYQDMQVIRQEIEAEFWKMRKEIQTTS